MANETKNPELEGEGNHEADRHYRESTEQFVKSGKVGEAADEARRAWEQNPGELEEAEKVGRSHVAEEDPEVRNER
jgi:hypothetical protein